MGLTSSPAKGGVRINAGEPTARTELKEDAGSPSGCHARVSYTPDLCALRCGSYEFLKRVTLKKAAQALEPGFNLAAPLSSGLGEAPPLPGWAPTSGGRGEPTPGQWGPAGRVGSKALSRGPGLESGPVTDCHQ